MAKNCGICGKSLGLVGRGTPLVASDEKFKGYDGRLACLDCGNAIERAQDLIKAGARDTTDVEFFLQIGKEHLENIKEDTTDESLRAALDSLLSGADYAINNPGKTSDEMTDIDFDIYGTPLMQVNGCRGRKIYIYEHFVVIKTMVTVGSVITGNATDGEKTIYYKDCVGVQFKEPGVTIGYIQLETASGQMNNHSSNMFGENTFTYDTPDQDRAKEAYKYIFKRIFEEKVK